MKSRLTLSLSVGLFTFLAACATPPTESASPSVAPQQTAAANTQTADSSNGLDPNEEICKRVHVTGSRFPSEVCMTRAQWDSERDQGKGAVDSIQRGTLRSCAAGAGCAGG